MEFTNLWQDAVGQGTMFWPAAGLIGLGTLLMLIAGLVHLGHRRGRSHRPTARSRQTTPVNPGAAAAPAASALETLSPPEARAPAPPAEARPLELETRALSRLLDRLRTAADKLEAARAAPQPGQPLPTAQSSLKETRPGVDYVFRAGTG